MTTKEEAERLEKELQSGLQPDALRLWAAEAIALLRSQAAEIDKANALLRDIGEWMDRGQGSSSEELILFIQERKQLRAAIKTHLGEQT